MKSAALKFLAIGGVALAAYPIVVTLRPNSPLQARLPETHLPEIIRPGTASNSARQAKSTQTETALSLSPQISPPLNSGSSVTIKPDAAGHFITKAVINGVQIPLMFDTGASIMALSYEDATKLGLKLSTSDFRSQIQTANGLAPAAELTLKEVRVDGIVIQDVPAMILQPGKLEISLMGRSFWGRLKTGFSYAAGNLILKN